MLPLIRDITISLTYPLTLSFWLLAFGVILLVLHQRKLAAAIMVFAIAWSLTWSLPLASDWLRSHLASRFPVVDAAALPQADAIVVLAGGKLGWLNRPAIQADELEHSRLAAGVRAWQADRAPVIILTGSPGETHAMTLAVTKLGVPSSAFLLENQSRNTQDSAMFTAELANRHGIRKILLVTSAVHMPRAMLLFRQACMDAVAVPVPEPNSAGHTWRGRWLPSRSALWRSGRAFKEFIGLLAASNALEPTDPVSQDRSVCRRGDHPGDA
ncbi:YdcF family protein [Luteimonas suaedae]|uniref:YdcF family protein n=1 Tax=Luteimonas suaedae TaxID=2605430 RepID=UPI0011F061A5|nr:YdcF family protein [Luteimonas suaedae]